MLPRCLLIVGHAGYGSRGMMGAYSPQLDLSEWQFNARIVKSVSDAVTSTGEVECSFDFQTPGNDVARWRDAQDQFDFMIDMHLNAHRDPSAHGAEVLCWQGNETLAAALLAAFCRPNVLAMRNRGVIALTADDRRAWLTKRVRPPVFTMEPGFLSNTADMARILANDAEATVRAYVNGICDLAAILPPAVETRQPEPDAAADAAMAAGAAYGERHA